MKSANTFRWTLAALGFGAAVLPLLVYMTGVRLLGPYSEGGVASFYGHFLADLARLQPAAWTLLLGPAILVLVWRVLAAYAWVDEEAD